MDAIDQNTALRGLGQLSHRKSRGTRRGAAVFLVVSVVVPATPAAGATPVPFDPTPPPDPRTLTVRVSGERLNQSAPLTIRGISGQASGYSRMVRVNGSRTVRRLPEGRYRVRAELIMADGRTSAAAKPVRYVTVRAGREASVTFHYPPAPRLPRNFTGSGRYIVRDLGVDVPFTWHGSDGNSQMIAGGPGFPIHFTNVIFGGTLYTQTLKWPGVTKHDCDPIGPLDRTVFNDWFETSRYVGRVILQGQHPRKVNHFRVGFVFPPDLPSGAQLRLPVASADIFVDQRDSGRFWGIQHFGIQNLYDPQLDEWIQMNSFTRRPGRVSLPAGCPTSGG